MQNCIIHVIAIFNQDINSAKHFNFYCQNFANANIVIIDMQSKTNLMGKYIRKYYY